MQTKPETMDKHFSSVHKKKKKSFMENYWGAGEGAFLLGINHFVDTRMRWFIFIT